MTNNKSKIILHLCSSKVGSDTIPYKDAGYTVKYIDKNIGVENYYPDPNTNIYGIIANPPCTNFSRAKSGGKPVPTKLDFDIVCHCLRIIGIYGPKLSFWAIENPASGSLCNYLGNPLYEYQPWWFGDPWTKLTALWGVFNLPKRIYYKWESVPKNNKLYIRPGREKPSIAFMHKNYIKHIPSFKQFINKINCDADFRSLCPQGFANAFFEANR